MSANHRMVNLVLALADDPGRVSREWIFHNVDGYSGVAQESAERYLRDDVAKLIAYGVPIGQGSFGLRLDAAQWHLNDPQFTEAEAAVVAAAARVAFQSEDLQELVASGWRKLAPTVHRSSLDSRGNAVMIADPVDLGSDDFATLIEAQTPPRKQVSFWYSRQMGADDEKRFLEPWRILSLRGRFYVIGYDTDREDVRIFRLTRVHEVKATEFAASQPRPDTDMQALAEKVLGRNEELVTVVVRIKPGRCGDVRAIAKELADDQFQLPAMTRRAVVDIALANVGLLTVETPVDVREEVIARLTEIAEV